MFVWLNTDISEVEMNLYGSYGSQVLSSDPMWCGVVRCSPTWPNVIWCGPMWVWCGPTCSDAVQCGRMQSHMVWCDLMRSNVFRCGWTQSHMVRCGLWSIIPCTIMLKLSPGRERERERERMCSDAVISHIPLGLSLFHHEKFSPKYPSKNTLTN